MFVVYKRVDVVLSLLAERGSMSAKEIATFLEKQCLWCKQAQLYTMLQRMCGEFMLFKQAKKYSLHTDRVITQQKRMRFADPLFHQLRKKLSTWQPFYLRLSSFLDLREVWSYYASLLFSLSGAQAMYKFSQHNAFSVSKLRESDPQRSYFNYQNTQQFHVCGGATPLDKKGEKLLPHANVQRVSIGKNLFHFSGYTMCIIGDFFFRVDLSQKLLDDIEQFYQSVVDPENYDPHPLQSILRRKTGVTLHIEKNSHEANVRREELKKWF